MVYKWNVRYTAVSENLRYLIIGPLIIIVISIEEHISKFSCTWFSLSCPFTIFMSGKSIARITITIENLGTQIHDLNWTQLIEPRPYFGPLSFLFLL